MFGSKIPSKLAPLFGAIVGAYMGFLPESDGLEGSMTFTIGGAIIGGFAGCIIWLLDRSKPNAGPEANEAPSDKPSKGGSVWMSLVAVLGVLAFLHSLQNKEDSKDNEPRRQQRNWQRAVVDQGGYSVEFPGVVAVMEKTGPSGVTADTSSLLKKWVFCCLSLAVSSGCW